MKTKFITLIFILSMLTGCVAPPPPVVGDPQLIYDASARMGGLRLAATFVRGYLDSTDGWTAEHKEIWTAYFAYYTAAQLKIARGDLKGFDANMKAAEEQLRILTRSVWEI